MSSKQSNLSRNSINDSYKLQIVLVTSNKFELTVSEEKVTIKKGEKLTIIITLKFSQYVTMGLTGQIGMINGVLSMIKNESVAAFKYSVEDEFEKQDFEFIKNVYRDIHYNTILGMCGTILKSSTILLDGDTICDLQHLMKNEKLSTLFLLQSCSDCANALNYLSSNRIIHRNIKPSKLRVVHHDITNEGKCIVKLNDMTTIYKLQPNEFITKSPGTYQYMAPEVMELKDHGLPTDVYSFGMTMYHIFTNEIPYKNFSNSQIQQHVCNGNRVDLNDTLFPNGIVNLISKCWDSDCNKRPI
ncbi:Ephrin type-A receptor 4A [Entamoeba marina]